MSQWNDIQKTDAIQGPAVHSFYHLHSTISADSLDAWPRWGQERQLLTSISPHLQRPSGGFYWQDTLSRSGRGLRCPSARLSRQLLPRKPVTTACWLTWVSWPFLHVFYTFSSSWVAPGRCNSRILQFPPSRQLPQYHHMMHPWLEDSQTQTCFKDPPWRELHVTLISARASVLSHFPNFAGPEKYLGVGGAYLLDIDFRVPPQVFWVRISRRYGNLHMLESAPGDSFDQTNVGTQAQPFRLQSFMGYAQQSFGSKILNPHYKNLHMVTGKKKILFGQKSEVPSLMFHHFKQTVSWTNSVIHSNMQ